MKVLIITAAYPPFPSGISDYCQLFAGELVKQGNQVMILTTAGNSDDALKGVEVRAVMEDWSWPERSKVKDCVQDFQPDVINIHLGGDIYGKSKMLLALPTYISKDIKVVPMIHDRLSRRKKSFFKRSITSMAAEVLRKTGIIDENYMFLLKGSSTVFLSNTPDLEYYKYSYSKYRNKYKRLPIPPTIEVEPENHSREEYRKMFNLPEDGIYLSFHGFIQPGKGVEHLVKALDGIWEEFPELRLIFIGGQKKGSEYFEQIKELVEKYCVPDRVHWTGYVDRKDLGRYLRASDFAVLPLDGGVSFKRSSFANLIAHGLPVVGTKSELLEPELIDGENVLLCEPENTEAIREKIKEMLTSENLRQSLSLGADKLYENCSLEAVVRQFVEIVSR